MKAKIKSLMFSAALAALLSAAAWHTVKPAQAVNVPPVQVAPLAADCAKLPPFSADEPLRLRLLREECRNRAAADAYALAWRRALGE